MSEASKRAWFERHRQVNAWVEPKDFEELKRRADEAGLTLSAYVRQVIAAELQSK